MVLFLLITADMRVTIDTTQLRRGTLTIDLELSAEPERLCTKIVGAGVAVSGLTRLPDDADCFGGKKHARYTVSLDKLEDVRSDPDFASSKNGAWLFNDQAVVLRPEPLPDSFDVELSFTGSAVAFSVWPKQGERFTANRNALNGGNYWALGPRGKIEALPSLEVAGRQVGLVRWIADSRAPLNTLTRWVQTSLEAVATFHGMLPAERMQVFLVPASLSSSAGVFGTVLRRYWTSAVLIYGARAPPEEFFGEWVAVHELFHSVMPHAHGRPAWFIEGFTTYYQDVLRARQGMRPAQDMWDDLHDSVVRFCQPRHGRSLQEDSDDLHKEQAYQRVYWGGACLALSVDVAIRARTDNRESLDTVLRQMWHDSMSEPLEPDDIVRRLDTAAGAPIAEQQLQSHAAIDWAPLYGKLGLRRVDDEHVALLQSAPLVRVRDAIMQRPTH